VYRSIAILRVVVFVAGAAVLAGCAGGQGSGPLHNRESAIVPQHGYYKVGAPYEIDGVTYTPQVDYNYDETGIASWYGPDFHGLRTANGELYDMNQVTAAHKTLPLPSLVKVTNLDNGRQIVVRVNDRGPYARGRIIDMSRRSAQLLGFEKVGTAKVRVQIMAHESQVLAEAAKQGVLAVDIAGIDPDQPPPLPPTTPSYTRSGPIATNLPPTPQYRSDQPQPVYRNPQVAQEPLPPPYKPPVQVAQQTPPDVAVVDEKSMMERENPGKHLKGQDIGGLYLPSPLVTAYKPVKPTGIYIQAGAFGFAANAEKLRVKLVAVGKTDISTATVNGQTFYRVRVGPIATVEQADQMLNRVVGAGANGAKIVVN